MAKMRKCCECGEKFDPEEVESDVEFYCDHDYEEGEVILETYKYGDPEEFEDLCGSCIVCRISSFMRAGRDYLNPMDYDY